MSILNVNQLQPVGGGNTITVGSSNIDYSGSITGNISVDGNLTVTGVVSNEDVTNIDSVGVVTARSGVNITGGDLTLPDAIIHTGDTNTRIRFPASDTFTVETAGNERLRITSSGNVGIGSDNPTEKLDVNGGLKVYANTNIATFKNNQLRSDAAGAYYFDHGTTGQSFTFRTSTSSSLDTTGPSVTSAGNISFPSGKGIDFSADGNASGMTSELLDDYEEGTFTPIVRGRTTAGTASYGRTAVGKYTKVGRMVDVMVDMVFSGANGSGNIEIAGLPYAAHNGPYVRFAGDITLLTAGISWSNQLALYINDTNSHFWLTNTPTSGNFSFVNINSNTTEVLLNCTYMVS